jgi:anti-sigma factor RsiW
MKDQEFIELLNLYLDHEISPADAARLEAEVQSNPRRHQIYRQYCRMQKACTVLSRDFASEQVPAASVVAFEQPVRRSSPMGAVLAFGGLAAAACVAVFVGLRQRTTDAVAATIAQKSINVAPVAVADNTPALRPGLVHAVSVPTPPSAATGNRLLLSKSAQAEALMAAAADQTEARFEWMRTVQLTPLPQGVPAENLRFDSVPAAPIDLRPRDSRTAPNTEPEWVGFKFTK